MQSPSASHAADSHLRFLFDGSVVSLNRAVDMTFGEIAEALDGLTERHGDPVAIDLTLGSPDRRRPGFRRAPLPTSLRAVRTARENAI